MRISAFFLSLLISFELILSPILGGIFIKTAQAEDPCPNGYYRSNSGMCVLNSDSSRNALGARDCAEKTNVDDKKKCYEALSADKLEGGAAPEDGKWADENWRRMNQNATGSAGASIATAMTIMLPLIMLAKQGIHYAYLNKKDRSKYTCRPAGLLFLYGGAAVLGAGELISFFTHRSKMSDLKDQWNTLASSNNAQNQDAKNEIAFVAATKAWEFQANTEFQMEKTTKLKAGYYAASSLLFLTGGIVSAVENQTVKTAYATLKTLSQNLALQKLELDKIKIQLVAALAATPASAAAITAIRQQAMVVMEGIKKNSDLYAATMKTINRLTCHAGYTEKKTVEANVADKDDPKIPTSQQESAVINEQITDINKVADDIGNKAEVGIASVDAKLKELERQKIQAEQESKKEVNAVATEVSKYVVNLGAALTVGQAITLTPSPEAIKNGIIIKEEAGQLVIKPIAADKPVEAGPKPTTPVVDPKKIPTEPIIRSVWKNMYQDDIQDLIDQKYRKNIYSVISQADNLVDLVKGFKEIETMESSTDILNSEGDSLLLSLLNDVKIDPRISTVISQLLISNAHAQAAPAATGIGEQIMAQQKIGDALGGFQKEIKFINGEIVGHEKIDKIDKNMNDWFTRQFVRPKNRIIVNGVFSFWTGVMTEAMYSQSVLSKKRGEKLLELQAQFKSNEGLLGCTAELRNDSSRPECYCYTPDNKINTARSNHVACKGVASNTPNGTNYLNKTRNIANPCVDQNFGLDPKCSCKNRKNSSGQNSCMNVSISASSGILNPGSFKMLGSAIAPGNNILSGDSVANIDGAMKTQAAAMRKMKDEIVNKTEPGLSQKINKDIEKVSSALQGAFSGMQMGGATNLASSESPISSDPKKAVEEIEKSLKGALTIPDFSTPTPMAADDELPEPNLDVTEETELAEVMGKELDYGSSDISNNSSINIFDVLSNRYQRSGMRRLFDESGATVEEAPAGTDITP